MKENKPVLKLKSAWLITWEWMGDFASVVDQFAGIVNYRKSEKHIIEFVEFLYNYRISNLCEIASYAKNKKNIPYKAEADFNCNIICGSHPWLHARYVNNIEIFLDLDSNIETISWETQPQYKPTDSGPKIISESKKEGITRLITGPLSTDSMWDRRNKKIKDQYLNLKK